MPPISDTKPISDPKPAPCGAPCGSWTSPVTEESITRGTGGLGFVAMTPDAVYWTELRPWDKGRSGRVRHTAQAGAKDISAPDHTVRSRVHEYGGRAFAAAGPAGVDAGHHHRPDAGHHPVFAGTAAQRHTRLAAVQQSR